MAFLGHVASISTVGGQNLSNIHLFFGSKQLFFD